MIERQFDKPILDPSKIADWTFNGMKVYNFDRGFNKNNQYVESFDTEDYQSWIKIISQEKWTDEIRQFAKEQGII